MPFALRSGWALLYNTTVDLKTKRLPDKERPYVSRQKLKPPLVLAATGHYKKINAANYLL